MKKLLLFLLLILSVRGYSQCNISNSVSSHLLGTLPPNVLPANVPITYTFGVTFSPNSTNRIVEVTFGAGFIVQPPNTPYTLLPGNVWRFDLSNATTSNAATFSVWGTIDCGLCTGSNIEVTMRTFENDAQFCTKTISNAIWNESLPWIVQSLRFPLTTNVPRGSTVRYHVSVSNNNECFRRANAGRTIEIIDQIPTGAIFQQAFVLSSTSNIPINLPTRNIGPNQVGIELSPSVSTEFYIDILYPCDFIDNTATNRLSYLDATTVPCPFSQTINANDLTLNILPPLQGSSGASATIVKRTGAPGFTSDFNPGGTVAFEITFTNNGNIPLRDIVITDVLPPNFTGTHAAFQGTVTAATQVGNPFTLSALFNNQWQVITSSTYPNAPHSGGFRLTVNPNHTLFPNESIRFWVYGTTAPNGFNETFRNNATANYLPVSPNCPPNGSGGSGGQGSGVASVTDSNSFTTAGRAPRIKIGKLVCPKSCFNVGDEIQFQLHVINEGNAPLDAQGITIADILPPNLTLIGGSERYYLFPYTMPGAHPSFIDCAGDTQYRRYQIINPGFISSNNNNGATSLSWHIGNNQLVPNPSRPSPIPPAYTLYSDRIVITFTCRINNTSLPGNIGQNYQVSTNRDSIVADINTSYAVYVMCPKDELTAEKLISVNGSVFTHQVNAPAGSTVRYQIRLTNTGNMPLTQIRIADDMPHIGDRRLGFYNGQACSQRNSQFEISANHNNTINAGSIAYFTQHNPCVSSLFNYNSGNAVTCCGNNQPTVTSQNPAAQGFFINLGGLVLQPGDVWTYEFDGALPPNLNNGLTSCNSLSYRAMRANSNIVLEFGESNTACVTIQNETKPDGCDLCKDLVVTPVNGRLTPQQTRSGIAYQLLQNRIRILAPNNRFNQIRVNVISYTFESNYDECLIADPYAFNNAGINGDDFQQISPIVYVNGQPTSPYDNSQHINFNTSEVTWKAPQPFNLSNAVDLPIQFFLPAFSKLECCKVSANICVRVTFINDECEICERIICFSTDKIDEEEVLCNCSKEGDFSISYDTKKRANQKKYATTVTCDNEVKIPAGIPVTMNNNIACEGNDNCKPRYEWKLVQASTRSIISQGNGNTISFTLPQSGEIYQLYIQTYCGSSACERACKIAIKAGKP